MRGPDRQTGSMFSYVSPEALVPSDHPLRAIRLLVNAALERLSGDFDALYVAGGRDSIAPEKPLRALLLLQAFCSVRSERRLMEQVTYNMLFRWFTKHCYAGHVVMENRHGLAFAATMTWATGAAERDAGEAMMAGLDRAARSTLGADKNYDTRNFVAAMRGMGVTPHVAQHTNGRPAKPRR